MVIMTHACNAYFAQIIYFIAQSPQLLTYLFEIVGASYAKNKFDLIALEFWSLQIFSNPCCDNCRVCQRSNLSVSLSGIIGKQPMKLVSFYSRYYKANLSLPYYLKSFAFCCLNSFRKCTKNNICASKNLEQFIFLAKTQKNKSSLRPHCFVH